MDNRAVVSLAIDPGLPGFEGVRLKGNTEDLLVRFLEGDLAAGAHWLDYGVAEASEHAPAPKALDHGVVVVHGHSISREPETRPNRIGIDTGAWRSGVLTCLALEGAERAFLQT